MENLYIEVTKFCNPLDLGDVDCLLMKKVVMGWDDRKFLS